MDKDRRVSIETISAQFDVSVANVHTFIREELKMRKICAKFVPRVLREDQKERRYHDSREKVELVNSDPAVLDVLVICDESCFKLGKNATETYGMLQTAFRPSCLNRASVFEWHKRFKEGWEFVRDDERCARSKEVNTPELIGQRVRVRVTMLRF